MAMELESSVMKMKMAMMMMKKNDRIPEQEKEEPGDGARELGDEDGS
jgi:hypothetical protein